MFKDLDFHLKDAISLHLDYSTMRNRQLDTRVCNMETEIKSKFISIYTLKYI